MELAQRLSKALRVTSSDLNRALGCFDPAPGRDNSYPERMVSYYYIRALAKALPGANVLLEIPVTGRSKRGWDNHIDALIFNDREVIAAEFKVAWAPSHWVALARDLERLRGSSVAKELRTGFTDRRRRRSYILLGADCWYRRRADAWKSGVRAGTRALPKSMLASQRDYLCVYPETGRDYDGYYLTWALFPFREMAA